MKRVPIAATIVVAMAVAAMIALGLWQLLDRRPQKLALIAQIARNLALPPIAYPDRPDQRLLYRRTRGYCVPPALIMLRGAGSAGYRAIARCRTDMGGPALLVQLGTTRDAKGPVRWAGGWVSGYLAQQPDGQSMIARIAAPAPFRLMMVADRPAPGLQANRPPDLDAIPNNHLAYGVQWFVFAGIAVVVYVLALRRRGSAAAR